MGDESKTVKGDVFKVDEALGLVFGWAIVCTEKGEPYYDLNVDRDGEHKGKKIPEHISESVMLKAATDFAEQAERPGNVMHAGPDSGSHLFLFPMTGDIAKALGIQTDRTGLLCAYKPDAEVLEKFKTGEFTGFSIQGWHENSELIDA